LWNKEKQELAGAYRAGNTDEIIRSHGIKGLYTNTVFRYDEQLFLKIGSALELGRSFVRPEYQRQYAPLLLLWKGIARFVAAHPETPVLFGAVSISNEYSSLSREMIVRYFEQRSVNDEDGREFADLIQARTPFRAPKLRRWDCGAVCSALRDLDELAEPISDVEEDGKGLPILIKQYAKVGGRLVGFNSRPQILRRGRWPGDRRPAPDRSLGPRALYGKGRLRRLPPLPRARLALPAESRASSAHLGRLFDSLSGRLARRPLLHRMS
jgi:hypothetical protein